jgi:hypothetical protein
VSHGPIKSIDQIGVVVRDLDEAMARYTSDFGLGPWSVFTVTEKDCPGGMTFRGKKQPHSFRAALATIGGISYELLQPLDGESTYWEFLEKHGEGVHHLGFLVESVDETTSTMQALGYSLIQSGHGLGNDDDGAYAYYETDTALGCIYEALEVPGSGMPEPERVVTL